MTRVKHILNRLPALTQGLLTAALLVMLCGGHVGLFQCVAWSTMLIERLPQRGWDAALDSTFSGAEPCSLCTAIDNQQAADLGFSPKRPKHKEWRVEALPGEVQICQAMVQPAPWWLQLAIASQRQEIAWIHQLDPPPPKYV